jgi:hypothetical protein
LKRPNSDPWGLFMADPIGKLPQKMCLFFWAYFIHIEKRNNFVADFFSIRVLFRQENSI